MENKTKQINLKDGRSLGYAEFGAKNGHPIIYCHGSQSSRLEMHYNLSFAHQNNLRIITIDRPGHGLSDFNPNGNILSFAQDVIQLCGHLNLEQFSVTGMSAGAPFAMGIAHQFPHRVEQLNIISGFAPYTQESKKLLSKKVNTMLKLAKSFPGLLRFMLKIQNRQLKKNPQKALANFLKIMSPPDQEVLKNKSVIQVIESMFMEAFRNGSKGVAHEISKVLVQDWGFHLEEIQTPTNIWQGELDENVPVAWAKLLHQQIPNSNLSIYPKEGHLIIFSHANEIFNLSPTPNAL